MKKIAENLSRFAALGAIVGLSLGVIGALSLYDAGFATAQQSGGLLSLRGETEIPEENLPPDVKRQDTRADRFARAYRQQPPLIPHRVQGYQITRTVNQCMNCHDWPYSVEEGATKISETHYFNREGVALDRVSPSRWFCTQCHVPQASSRVLVGNDFKSAKELGQ